MKKELEDYFGFVREGKIMGGEKNLKNLNNIVAKKSTEVIKSAKEISSEDVIREVVKIPIVKVDREKFLRKELRRYYPKEVVDQAIMHNPAYVGIGRKCINSIAKQVINYETNKVAAISFAAGIPGGFAMAVTVPADIAQYFGFMIRVMQKLAYLYGFEDFRLNEDEISDDTLNQMLVFFGVMFGVQGANTAVKKIAEAAANKVAKSLARKALTKTAIYPLVKKIATKVGIQMTKEIFAESVSKVIPVVGGVVSGGLSYITFKPCSLKLMKSFKELPISDPEFYRKAKNERY